MEVQDILDEFGTKLVNDVRKSLEDKQKAKAASYKTRYNANSRLSASIDHSISLDGDSVVLKFVMADYYQWVDLGRNPGKVSEDANIEQWAKVKGIDPRKRINDAREEKRKATVKKPRVKKLKSVSYQAALRGFAFVVKRKLKEKGYEANHFYSSVIQDGRIEKLQQQVKEQFKKDLTVIFDTQSK